MNSIHDLGGMEGFGPILTGENDQNEPPYYEDWQKPLLAMIFGPYAAGHFDFNEFRYAIERMGAAEYLTTGYYEHWLVGLETLLFEKGLVTPEELEARMKELAAKEN